MYLEKAVSKTTRENIVFVGVLKVSDEKSRIRSRSISQRYGSADLDL